MKSLLCLINLGKSEFSRKASSSVFPNLPRFWLSRPGAGVVSGGPSQVEHPSAPWFQPWLGIPSMAFFHPASLGYPPISFLNWEICWAENEGDDGWLMMEDDWGFGITKDRMWIKDAHWACMVILLHPIWKSGISLKFNSFHHWPTSHNVGFSLCDWSMADSGVGYESKSLHVGKLSREYLAMGNSNFKLVDFWINFARRTRIQRICSGHSPRSQSGTFLGAVCHA